MSQKLHASPLKVHYGPLDSLSPSLFETKKLTFPNKIQLTSQIINHYYELVNCELW